MFLNKTEFPQAVMARGALACVNDAVAFDVVLQQLCVGHGVFQVGADGSVCNYYGERTLK
jgi:hypothetical protein